MSKCVGNCAICELEVNKQACCSIQTLKNIIEVKGLLIELRTILTTKSDSFADIPDIETEPTALGTVKKKVKESEPK